MKTTFALLALFFGLATGVRAQEFTLTYYLSGAWWETKTAPTNTLDAGEIRIWLYSDNVAQAERDFDDEVFDFCEGTWAETRDRFGVVTSVQMRFISDFEDEVFTITAKRGKVKGKFTGRRSGNVQATVLDPPEAALKKSSRARTQAAPK